MSKLQEKQLENRNKFRTLLNLIISNNVPNMDLDKTFDMSDWTTCLFGVYRLHYKLRTDFNKTSYFKDARKRFGFNTDVAAQIFGYEYPPFSRSNDYAFYAKRALEILENQNET